MHPRVSINGVCFAGMKIKHQFAHCHQAKCSRISLISLDLEKESVASALAAAAASKIQVECIVHPFFPFQPIAASPDAWQEPRRRLAAAIDAARQLGAKSIYMTTGGLGDLTWEAAAEAFAEAVAPCVEQARDSGVQVAIENASPLYADIHIGLSLADTLRLARMANLGICLDLFFCWTQANLNPLLDEVIPLTHLVQVSDYCYGDRSLPARAVPGDGDMPLPRLLEDIHRRGYQGAYELELLGPRIEKEGRVPAVTRAVKALSKQLEAMQPLLDDQTSQ